GQLRILRIHLVCVVLSHRLQPHFQTSFNKFVEVTIKHGACVACFHVGTQVLDTGLVQNVGTDLAAPADIRFFCFHSLCFLTSLHFFELVQFGFQLFNGLVLVLVL